MALLRQTVTPRGDLTPCIFRPTDELYPKIYHSCFFFVTYLAPLGLMGMAYFQIFRKLWGPQVRLVCCRCLRWEGEGLVWFCFFF